MVFDFTQIWVRHSNLREKLSLWSFHDRLGPGLGEDGAALTLQGFELSVWNLAGWCTVPSVHHADCYIQWLCLVNFCAFTGLQHFPWQAWIRSEGRWLILGNVRKSHESLKFGGMMKCTMKRITIWNGRVYSDLSPPRVLSFSECRMVICRLIIYPNIVVSIIIFENLVWYISLLSGI